MEEKKATVMDKISPDLLEAPHVVDKLFQLVMGEKKTDPSQLEQIAAHLTECSYCRTTLIVLLSAEQEYERLNDPTRTSAHDLLSQLGEIHLTAETLNYEQMGAYAEAIVAEGKEDADRRFSVIAAHIKACSVCQALLEEILDALNEAEE
jgi:hypothetical protein